MPDGIAILPIIMVFTTYFQTKQSMTAMTDPTQKKMMTFMMPAMMFVFSAVMPSGLVLYWIVSNLGVLLNTGLLTAKRRLWMAHRLPMIKKPTYRMPRLFTRRREKNNFLYFSRDWKLFKGVL
jgi:YidC/Oxa1 family membrane protein insertase